MYEPTLTEPVMRGFVEQLSKEALAGNAIQAGLGSGLGLGLGAGLAVGGAHGLVKGYREARGQGQGIGASAVHGLQRGLGGAARGAMVGSLAGGALGAAAGGMRPQAVQDLTKGLAAKNNTAGSFSRFGQRQVHSLTGWAPGGTAKSVESIGAGAAGPRAALAKAMEAGNPVEVARAKATLGATEKAQEMGLTSLPGIAKSIGREGLLPTAKAGLHAGWAGASPRMKALMVGLPAMQAVQALRAPGGENGQGMGKGERIGRLAGGTLGTMAAPLSLAGSLALSSALERGGGAIGKGVDRMRRGGQQPVPSHVPHEPARPPATEPGDTGQVATERVFGSGYSGGSGGLE
jgi:hypothetical protein